MAASQSNVAFDNTSDATFRAWAQKIEDALIAGGFSVETQTGQADLTTMTRGSAGSVSNFKVYKSPAISGLNRWFIKIQFGSGTGANTQPQLVISTGWGTDGAGNLTTSVSTPVYCVGADTSAVTGQAADATARKWWFSVSTNGIMMAINTGATNGTNPWCFLVIERTLSSAIAQQDELFINVQSYNASIGNAKRTTQITNRTTGAFPVISITMNTTNQYGTRITDSNSLQGGAVGLSTIAGQKGGFANDARGMVGAFGTNLGSAETQVQFDLYGTNINFLILGTPMFFHSTTHQLLMRYE